MFWGITLRPGVRYTNTIEQETEITRATFEFHDVSDAACVKLICEENEFVLCYLDSKFSRQVDLKLNFHPGEVVSFVLHGSGLVHLLGNRYPDPGSDDDSDYSPSEGSDTETGVSHGSDEDEDTLSSQDLSGPMPLTSEPAKKPATETVTSSSFVTHSEGLKGSLQKKKQLPANDSGSVKLLRAAFGKENVGSGSGPGPDSSTPNEKKRKGPMALDASLDSGFKKKKTNSDIGLQLPQTPGVRNTFKKKGVTVSIMAEGHGPRVEEGKEVLLVYRGILKSTGTEFEDCTSGKGVRFVQGRRQVPRGLEIGIEGMRVGEKRRLEVPPKHGYGETGLASKVPPCSSLIYDVELKSVK